MSIFSLIVIIIALFIFKAQVKQAKTTATKVLQSVDVSVNAASAVVNKTAASVAADNELNDDELASLARMYGKDPSTVKNINDLFKN